MRSSIISVHGKAMPRRSEDCYPECRFFDIEGRLAETREELYSLWEMLDEVRRDVQALKAPTKSRRRGKRGGKRTARSGRK